MTHVFKPGRYKTRDGREAVVLCDDAPGPYSVMGYIINKPDAASAECWLPNGHCFGGAPDDDDLMPPVTEPEQVVRWVHLWHDGSVTLNSEAKHSEQLVMGRTRVVVKAGQFDAEDDNTASEYNRGWNEALEAACAALKERGFSEDGSATPCVRALKRSV